MSGVWIERLVERLDAEYGSGWSSDPESNVGLARDLEAHGRVDGLQVVRCVVEAGVVCQAELTRPVAHLEELNARVYALFGLVAEDVLLVERAVRADHVEYAFVIGTASHGHRGVLTVRGANLPVVLRTYERRLLAQGAETLRLGVRHQIRPAAWPSGGGGSVPPTTPHPAQD